MANHSSEIIKAAKKGSVEWIKALLTLDPDLINARDKDGSTPLHCAAWKGHEQVVAFLLQAGADVNAHNENDHYGTTPLHAAAHGNQPVISELLIAHGAQVNAKDREGRTPMFHTTFHKAKAAAKVIEKHGG